jgi:hypothetical protein
MIPRKQRIDAIALSHLTNILSLLNKEKSQSGYPFSRTKKQKNKKKLTQIAS